MGCGTGSRVSFRELDDSFRDGSGSGSGGWGEYRLGDGGGSGRGGRCDNRGLVVQPGEDGGPVLGHWNQTYETCEI